MMFDQLKILEIRKRGLGLGIGYGGEPPMAHGWTLFDVLFHQCWSIIPHEIGWQSIQKRTSHGGRLLLILSLCFHRKKEPVMGTDGQV